MQVSFLNAATAAAALKAIEGEVSAHKNWIATAVEGGLGTADAAAALAKARELVANLRRLENAARAIREAQRLAAA